MARGADHDLAESAPDIGNTLDRASQWVGDNPAAFLLIVATILALTGAVGLTRWWGERGEVSASEAVAGVRAGFLAAMGAPPGASSFSEPANAETARRAREEFAGKFSAAAEEHPGTAAAVEAWIESGNLREQLGDRDAALEAWKRAVADAGAGTPLRGLALARLATGYESKGAFAEAGAAHEEAANIASYPLRHYAMADAARCFAAAGERDRAVALAERVASEAPDLKLPDHLQSRLDELRAR
jgi:tetratricopeptide (TPR) repeat protein